jgi:release factor glutamine methyltransferase
MECREFTAMAAEGRLRDSMREATRILAREGIDSAFLDAEVLLGHTLGISRETLLAQLDSSLSPMQAARFAALLVRRIEREPIAYIVGRQEFWSLDFQVTGEVLIPRPDTERLVEAALCVIARSPSDRPLHVLDLGTGSGAIVVALAKELPSASFFASDISSSALAIARRNAAANGVIERVQFCCGNLFDAFADKRVCFDLIISNPPYIRRSEIDGLETEVSRWEPRTALDGGVDGLDFYRRIAAEAKQFLSPRSALLVEIGAGTGARVLEIFAQAGFCRDAEIIKDYGGRERVVAIRSNLDGQRAN